MMGDVVVSGRLPEKKKKWKKKKRKVAGQVKVPTGREKKQFNDTSQALRCGIVAQVLCLHHACGVLR